jgi:hypothetical protein
MKILKLKTFFYLVIFMFTFLWCSRIKKTYIDSLFKVDIIDSRKYVQYSCPEVCGGFADRLKGILSSYAWSLITNRSFLIDMRFPCPIEELYDINEINWKRGPVKTKKLVETKRVVAYGWRDYTKMASEDIIDFSNRATNLISISSGLMFMNSFATNPSLIPRIKELGYEPRKFKLQYLFHEWYEKLFRLKPDMAAEYDLMLDKIKKREQPGLKLICAQLRQGGTTRGKADDNLVSEEPNKTSKLFWRFMKDTFIDKLDGSSTYMIYVTSDSTAAQQEAREYFGADKVVTFEDANFHFDIDFQTSLFQNTKKNCEKIRKTVLDFHLLRECDMGVASHSGFGMLGMWNRPDPSKDLYVYSTEDYIKRGVFSRKNLTFIKLNNLDEFFFSM